MSRRPRAAAPLRLLLVLAFTALAAFAPGGASAQNFLWRVSSLTNHVYLFGTIHAGRPEWYPLPRAVEQAFKDSRELVVEADVTDERAMVESSARSIYKLPDTLSKHVPAEDFARFMELLHAYQLPESEVVQLKPFMAVSVLVFAEWAREGYVPQLSVDAYLIRMAKAELKPVVELEGVEAQSKLIDSLTDEESRTVFAGTLTALEKGLADEQIRGMVKAWQVGDPNAMLDVVRKYDEKVPGATALEEKFIWSRNPAMVERIAGWLDGPKDPRLIAVGALHLVGPRGLVEALRSRGFVVQQLFVAPEPERGNVPGK
ncbi:MAG TPA: TraB/GumN family protein [Usitatibacter sp.]|nr:TraB/GumN family protein [Usitatibacter sp.]